MHRLSGRLVDRRELIEISVLEKALYKICYEAANRPDWIHIPLAGIVEIICHGK
jgi:maltose alpha-D-glucosyltransferase/alpha-amylase